MRRGGSRLAIQAKKGDLPLFLQYQPGRREKSDVFFLRPETGKFDPLKPVAQQAFNRAILEVLRSMDRLRLRSPALLKVHVGEPHCRTTMRPVFAAGSISYLSEKGMGRFFFGDTTVLYSGPRGYKNNDAKAEPYLQLARRHGWGLVAPFVVLDRPATSVPGRVEFTKEEMIRELDVGGRFSRFSLSGGFAACGTLIHHVHLTLHAFSHFALCIKGLTMGLAGRSGKLVMHQSYHPVVDEEVCSHCGSCIDGCPEEAFSEGSDGEPVLDEEKCIGCGECAADCPESAISMEGEEVSDWLRGEASISLRMVDHLMGLMSGRWEELVNIAHLYNITERCDCVDEEQEPICGDIGFLVGMNPFAVDCAARQILEERLAAEGIDKGIRHFYPGDESQAVFDYAREKYGVVTRPNIIEVFVKTGE